MGSLREELGVLREALRRYDLLLSAEDVDVSVLAADGLAAVRPGVAGETRVDDLDPVRRAVYKSAPDARVVLGIATEPAREVAQLPGGLRCLAQSAAYFHGTVASVGAAGEAEEALRGLQPATALAVRDEAKFYVIAASVGAAFVLAFYLHKACCRQLLVGAQATVEPEVSVWEHARSQVLSQDFGPGVEWPAVTAWISGDSAARAAAGESAVPEGEASVRKMLSEAHKDLNRRKLDELIWNHCSAKIPGEGGSGFLITAGDRLWSLMEPEMLVRSSANCTADILHSAVYDAVPSAGAVVHTHSLAIEAVSCLQAGLLEPPGSDFAGRVAYYDWEGVSDDWEECKRVTAAIQHVPNCTALIMKNHGAITFGADVSEALSRHLALDTACRDTLLAMSGGKPCSVLEALSRESAWLAA